MLLKQIVINEREMGWKIHMPDLCRDRDGANGAGR